MTDEIKYRLRRLTPEQKIAIVTDYNGNIPIAEIMLRHSISKRTLYRILKETIERKEVEDEKQEENREQTTSG